MPHKPPHKAGRSRPCRYCGRPVIDIVDANGTKQCLDAHHHPIYRKEDGENGPWVRVPDALVSHFATCTHSSQASRKGKGRAST